MSKLPQVRTSARLKPLGVRQLAPVFNLVQLGSRQGHFTALYLQPQFMAGLGLQLFTLLLGWLRLPGGVWHRAHARVLVLHGQFAGFVILRKGPNGACEIYMCALLPALRGQGLGRQMLQQALAAHARPGQQVVADCLPASKAMMALLSSLGFGASAPRSRLPRRYETVWRAA